MTEIEFLSWVRGTGLQWATVIFVAGVVIRLFEILSLGQKTNHAEAKGSAMAGGLRTIATRMLPEWDTFQRSPSSQAMSFTSAFC
jgi:hypothetical protein